MDFCARKALTLSLNGHSLVPKEAIVKQVWCINVLVASLDLLIELEHLLKVVAIVLLAIIVYQELIIMSFTLALEVITVQVRPQYHKNVLKELIMISY
jgi:hypothetical protein